MNEKKSILIVDDDIAHRTMLRILLDWEYEIIEADDGSTAIEKVEQQPFDLILMDIRMTNVSGLEALDQVKSFNPSIPVIMMTAYPAITTVAEAMKKGAYAYLTKPFEFDSLRQTIERAISDGKVKQKTGS
jgi:two-component system response regulator HydG